MKILKEVVREILIIFNECLLKIYSFVPLSCRGVRPMGKYILYILKSSKNILLRICPFMLWTCILWSWRMGRKKAKKKDAPGETRSCFVLDAVIISIILLFKSVFIGSGIAKTVADLSQLWFLGHILLIYLGFRIALFVISLLYYRARIRLGEEEIEVYQGPAQEDSSCGIWIPIGMPQRKDNKPSLTKPWEQIALEKAPQ